MTPNCSGGINLDPGWFLLVAFVACVLLVGTAFTQTSPAGANTPADKSRQTSAALEPFGAQDILRNPFAEPWSVSSERKAANDSAVAVTDATSTTAGDASTQPIQKTTYRLQPDPFNLNADLSAHESNDHPTVNSHPAMSDTATRLAAQSRTRPKQASKQEVMALNSKYDITRIGDRGVGNKLNFYSIDKEQALGRELSLQVEQQAKLFTDLVIDEYVNRIGQTLVRHSDAHVAFTIKVVDDEQVNAFALPGGFFYVNTGVLLAADDEAELAGVMAHEIAHVAARHATRSATRQQIWNMASLPLMFVGGPVGLAIRQFSSVAVPMSFLKFGRDAEREADFLGLEYQYASGYDPTAFVDFFEKLEADEKGHAGFVARAFMTHPMSDDRIRRAEAELEMLPPRDDYIVTTSEFDQVKARLISLTRGRSVKSDKPGLPTLRKHTVIDANPPILRKKPGAME
jgi:hypothetical protein